MLQVQYYIDQHLLALVTISQMVVPRAVTIHQTHDSVRITIFSWGGGRKKKKDF